MKVSVVTAMKTSRILLATAGALCLVALPARADDLHGSSLDPSSNAQGARHRSRSVSPAKGLQLADGLQTSGPLNGSGPGTIAARLSDDDWRKIFPRKDADK
jgi:hypothetical protein